MTEGPAHHRQALKNETTILKEISVYEIISTIFWIAMLCVASIVIGFSVGLITLAVSDLIDTWREARDLDPDEPIPFTLADELGADRQAVQR